MDRGIFNAHTDVNACSCTSGCMDTIKESALKVDSGRKIPCCTGESSLCQQHAGQMLYQLSYTPPPPTHTLVNAKYWKHKRSSWSFQFCVHTMHSTSEHFPGSWCQTWLVTCKWCLNVVSLDQSSGRIGHHQHKNKIIPWLITKAWFQGYRGSVYSQLPVIITTRSSQNTTVFFINTEPAQGNSIMAKPLFEDHHKYQRKTGLKRQRWSLVRSSITP